MFVIGGALLGAVIGAITARKRGGSRLDMAQYAAGFGIAFAIAGMLLTIGIHRLAV